MRMFLLVKAAGYPLNRLSRPHAAFLQRALPAVIEAILSCDEDELAWIGEAEGLEALYRLVRVTAPDRICS